MARFQLHLDDEAEEEEEEEEGGEAERESGGGSEVEVEISSPLMAEGGGASVRHPLSVVAVVVDALRRSLVLCGAGTVVEDGGAEAPLGLDIGCPTDVQHVAHVTFDRFDGFLGLPVELRPHLPPRVPSASASVFGVSAKSMQCSYDNRGNSVPTILLLMQRHLYSQGGLQVEGIFRINAENGQDVHLRDQLSKGVVPVGIDMHCLAGLIKAWFRELPTGVLDSITPDQMMHCNTEEECSRLLKMLPPMEVALLNWTINLMADVVEHERQNKMNARNIAMVFAPNMTQMADPLTALIHAVQVMNFLKTLIIKTLQEREEASEATAFQSCSESTSDKDENHSSKSTEKSAEGSDEKIRNIKFFDNAALGKFLPRGKHNFQNSLEENFGKKSEVDEAYDYISGRSSPGAIAMDALEDGCITGYGSNGNVEGNVGGIMDRLNFRNGVRKLCRHPLFQFSKSIGKSDEVGIRSPTEELREAWT